MNLRTAAVPAEIERAMAEANDSMNERARMPASVGFMIGMVCTALLGFGVVLAWTLWVEPVFRAKETVRYVSVTGTAVNECVSAMIAGGQSEAVYAFYDQYTGRRETTVLVVMNALTNEIPLHTFVSLGREEGRFSPQARNLNHSADGRVLSIDVGGYQLNTLTFRGYSIAELARTETNTRLAAQKMAADYRALADWTKALIWYNANKLDGVKLRTVLHVVKILNGERELDAAFVAGVMK